MMTTNQLAAILTQYPGVPILIDTGELITDIARIDQDCFDETEGPIIVITAATEGI